ncbi:hypothetical protein LIER_04511 [Lithospermum erythrorhizon]|uniref:Protein FAR1-RELATED SEQUENCE n=1 Tax=Lithospermum erythrorhizon TaxID=34254 RepID=A0AAV3NXE8_LITER
MILVKKKQPKSCGESLHENIPNELVPKIGMEFDIEKDAYDLYNKYAAYVGFSVKKHNGHYKNKKIVDRRRQIYEAESVGIAPKARMALFVVEEGGRENVGFIKDDYKNYLRSKRMIEMKMGDTGGVLEYLQRKQDEDPIFSYAIQVDIDDLVTNIYSERKNGL